MRDLGRDAPFSRLDGCDFACRSVCCGRLELVSSARAVHRQVNAGFTARRLRPEGACPHAEGAGRDYGRRSTWRLQEATAAIDPRWLVAGALEVVRRLLHLLESSLALDICPNETGNHEHAKDDESPLQQAVGHGGQATSPESPWNSALAARAFERPHRAERAARTCCPFSVDLHATCEQAQTISMLRRYL